MTSPSFEFKNTAPLHSFQKFDNRTKCPAFHKNIFNQTSIIYNSDPQTVLGVPLNLLQLIFGGYGSILLTWFGIIGNLTSIFALTNIKVKSTSVQALDFVWYLRFILGWDTVVIFCYGLSMGLPTILAHSFDFRNDTALNGASWLVHSDLLQKYFQVVPVSYLYYIGSVGKLNY